MVPTTTTGQPRFFYPLNYVAVNLPYRVDSPEQGQQLLIDPSIEFGK